jgi:hypothetical protein
MESAWWAAEACREALADGDFTRAAMKRYEDSWSRGCEPNWRTAEIFMSIAKNPDMADLSLFLLKQIGKLTSADPRFRDFAGGVFTGVISQNAWLVPSALYHAFPKDVATWLALLKSNGRDIDAGAAAGAMHLIFGTMAGAFGAAIKAARHPMANLDWSVELATKIAWIAERRLSGVAS